MKFHTSFFRHDLTLVFRNCYFWGMFTLYCFYSFQSLFGESGSFVFKAALIVLIIGNIVAAILILKQRSALSGAWQIAFFLICTLTYSFVASFSYRNDYAIEIAKGAVVSMGVFFVSAWFSMKQFDIRKQGAVVATILLALSAAYFLYNQNALLDQSMSNSLGVVNNSAYLFSCIAIFSILYTRSKLYAPFMLTVCIAFCLFSGKRGAMICVACVAIIYLWGSLIESNFLRSPQKSIYTFILITCFYGIINYIYNTNIFLQYRVDLFLSGDSSGRDEIYTTIIDEIHRAGLFDLFFGRGLGFSAGFLGFLAHNDWLEIAISMGALGLVAYFSIYVSLLKSLSMKYFDRGERRALLAIIIVLFLKSIFSMGFFEVSGFSLFLLLGMLLGKSWRVRKNRFIQKVIPDSPVSNR